MRSILTLAAALSLLAGAAAAQQHGRWPESADENGDGRLSQGEIRALAKQSFEAHDTDRNGAITLPEWIALAEERYDLAVVEGRAEAQPRDDLKLLFEDTFAEQDRDGDGRLTPAEWEFILQGHFARLDANGDGEVSREEVVGHRSDRD